MIGTVGKAWEKAFYMGDVKYNAYEAKQLSGATEGDEVSFDVYTKELNGVVYNNIKGNVQITRKANSSPPSTQVPTPGSSVPGAKITSSEQLPEHYVLSSGYATKLSVFPVPQDHPDYTFIRQHALTCAVSGAHVDTGEALTRARTFESYLSGADMETSIGESLEDLSKIGD